MNSSANWYKVDVFNLRLDLSPLLMQLQQQGIAYRVTEEPRGQCLWLDHAGRAEQLKEYLHEHGLEPFAASVIAETSWQNAATTHDGELFVSRKLLHLQRALRLYPITLGAILLGVLGALLVHFDPQLIWVRWLTFQPLQLMGQYLGLASVTVGLEQGQYWRLLTPMFLHFGLLHIAFNALWVWEFGRRIELGLGSGPLFILMLIMGVASNAGQYLWGGPSLFGGLSGVLYGLLGFLWIYNRIKPRDIFALPPGIIGFMLVWVVLGMTGAVDFFIDGSIANAAHVGGLVSGMLLAPLAARLTR